MLKKNIVKFFYNVLKNNKIYEYLSLGAFLKKLITIKGDIIQK